jgi:hypothetical protein
MRGHHYVPGNGEHDDTASRAVAVVPLQIHENLKFHADEFIEFSKKFWGMSRFICIEK